MLSKLKALVSGEGAGGRRLAEFKRQGDQYLAQERYDEAAQAYGQALALNPDHVESCVGLGFALSELGQHAQAEAVLRRALARAPDNADVHYILGTLARARGDAPAAILHYRQALTHQPTLEFAYRQLFELYGETGQSEAAKVLLEQGIQVLPRAADFHINLGLLQLRANDYAAALAAFRAAAALQPTAPTVQLGLARAYAGLGRLEESITCYRAELARQPDQFEALVGLGGVLERAGRMLEALACYEQAAQQQPLATLPHQLRGNALLALGNKAAALAAYREVLRLQPADPIAHLVAALSGELTERAPSGYVQRLFDEYAEHFDASLVGELRYDVPRKLEALLRERAAEPVVPGRVLDLGCGTGLSGLAFASYASELIGVDLSDKMLAKARERQIYTRLERADLLDWLRAEPAVAYDMVLATDVLIYLGRLDEVFEHIGRVLRPGGRCAFSLEALSADDPSTDYRLNPNGRYAHATAYVERLLARAGLSVVASTGTVLRMDQGSEVRGSLWVCRCGTAAEPC